MTDKLGLGQPKAKQRDFHVCMKAPYMCICVRSGEPPPTPPSIIKPPGLTPPPRPPRSERATPDPTPPGFARQSISRDSVEEDVRALISSSDRDEIQVAHISGLYRRKYGRMLDYKSLGFAKLTAFVAEIPGLELMNGAAGGSVR